MVSTCPATSTQSKQGFSPLLEPSRQLLFQLLRLHCLAKPLKHSAIPADNKLAEIPLDVARLRALQESVRALRVRPVHIGSLHQGRGRQTVLFNGKVGDVFRGAGLLAAELIARKEEEMQATVCIPLPEINKTGDLLHISQPSHVDGQHNLSSEVAEFHFLSRVVSAAHNGVRYTKCTTYTRQDRKTLSSKICGSILV